MKQPITCFSNESFETNPTVDHQHVWPGHARRAMNKWGYYRVPCTISNSHEQSSLVWCPPTYCQSWVHPLTLSLFNTGRALSSYYTEDKWDEIAPVTKILNEVISSFKLYNHHLGDKPQLLYHLNEVF